MTVKINLRLDADLASNVPTGWRFVGGGFLVDLTAASIQQISHRETS